jgi:transposase
MEYWDKAPFRRDQILLFAPTLDESISEDHPVRLLDEILHGRDWSAWEVQYDGTCGRPPIPPWVMAGVILYGLMRGIRSSRMLEYLCGHNIDYIWLVEGRTIDYSTICKFRTRFRQPLKDMFRQVVKVGIRMGLVTLVKVAFDGTRVKANASRFKTWTAEKLEAALKELEVLFDQAMAETERTDASTPFMATGPEDNVLPPDVATAKARHSKLKELLAEIQAADEARRQTGINPQKNPAQMPKADVDSAVMPNKEGGYAPNYTPLAATDVRSGWIVDADVVADAREDGQTLSTVDRIEENYGEKPAAFLADAQHATGENLCGMESRHVDFYSPVESSVPTEGNPAKRNDPRQPVPEADWPKLPRNDKKRLAKSCFIYDAQADCYYCPTGRVLKFQETRREQRNGIAVEIQLYRCRDCKGCPLEEACRDPNAKRARSVQRDQYEPARERMQQRMQSPEGKETYLQRMHAAETPFAHIKRVMGVRQFLLRGLEKVSTEWLWVCTAYNLKKLLIAIARLRAEFARMIAETTS